MWGELGDILKNYNKKSASMQNAATCHKEMKTSSGNQLHNAWTPLEFGMWKLNMKNKMRSIWYCKNTLVIHLYGQQ